MSLAQMLGLAQRPSTSAEDFSGTVIYRSEDGTTDFSFRIARHGDRYRIYILDQPLYHGRADDLHSTHRYHSPTSGHYICWDGRLGSLDDILYVASEWAERTLRYVRHGTPFDNRRTR